MTELPWRPRALRQLPERLQVGPGALHLWSIPLDPPEPPMHEWDALLSDDERNRANRFVQDRDRRRYRVAHAVLRLLLARYTGKDASALSFVLGPQGKPNLAGEDAISFNLSHSGELAILAISPPARLGVDIEQIRVMDDAIAIARSFFAPGEQAVLAGTPLADRDRTFMTCWTRKEAFIKALGGGLSIDLASFEVSLDREQPAFLRIDDPKLSAQSWSMLHFEPADGYMGAVVTDAAVNDMRSMRFDPAARSGE
jgi:4'-phosphopantetheinyl transferase